MVGYSGSRLDLYMLQVIHIKMQALITDHLISKIWGKFYSEHLKYDLTQYEGDESDLITLRQYLANMTGKTGKYAVDQLFHAISRDNNPTTVHLCILLIIS